MDIKRHLNSVHQILEDEGIEHALIGGLALGAHGLQRFTNDIDFLVLGDDRGRTKQAFLKRGYRVFFESAEVMQLQGPVQIDFLFANRELTKGMVTGAKPLAGFDFKCVSVEDIIGLKIQAYKNDPKREHRDKADIQGLIERHANLDWDQVKLYADLFEEWGTVETMRNLLKG